MFEYFYCRYLNYVMLTTVLYLMQLNYMKMILLLCIICAYAKLYLVLIDVYPDKLQLAIHAKLDAGKQIPSIGSFGSFLRP